MIIKQNNMVSKSDLENELKTNFEDMQIKIIVDTKMMVAIAVDPIQNKVYDISSWVEKLNKMGHQVQTKMEILLPR